MKSRWPNMHKLRERKMKKFPISEEKKMDWWDKFIKGLKEGRISVWFWILILLGMIYTFTFSNVNLNFSVGGDIDYSHPKIFNKIDDK